MVRSILQVLAAISALSSKAIFAQEVLESAEFKRLIEANAFAAVLDVRTRAEWDAGHIENSTLVESLNLFGGSTQISSPADLAGCEDCPLAVYCTTGVRANTAIGILQMAGFRGKLYNGQGVRQWTDAGFELATTASVPASCVENAGQCNVDSTVVPESTSSSEMLVGGTLLGLCGAMLNLLLE